MFINLFNFLAAIFCSVETQGRLRIHELLVRILLYPDTQYCWRPTSIITTPLEFDNLKFIFLDFKT